MPKQIKEDEYSNSLATILVCGMFRVGDTRRNVLIKFIRLCMETPCVCPSEGHKYGNWDSRGAKTTLHTVFAPAVLAAVKILVS